MSSEIHPTKIKVTDGFTFYNEVDMLDLRLSYLYGYVDEFLIVEADHKFNGQPKPFLLNGLMKTSRFAWAADKVTVKSVAIDTSGMIFSERPEAYDPSADFWKIEAAQRNAIRPEVMLENDFLLMGDVDEIPHPRILTALRYSSVFRAAVRESPKACWQEFFYYNPHCLKNERWHGTIVLDSAAAASMNNQELRSKRYDWPALERGGWHFSYFMSPQQISDKINSFSHQEYNTDYMRSEERIAEMIAQKRDVFERDEGFLPFDLENFPRELVRQLRAKFPQLVGG